MDDELNPYVDNSGDDLPAVDDYSDGYYNDPYGSWDISGIPESEIEALMNLGGTPEQQAATKNTLGELVSKAGTGILSLFKKGGTGADKDNIDWSKVATVGGGVLGLYKALSSQSGGGAGQPATYQGGIPKYEAIRAQVQGTYDPTRRPGSGGQRYFSDVQYAKEADAAAAREAVLQQARELEKSNIANPASERREKPVEAAAGGLMSGRYLRGGTDGMADKISASIENKQPAKLSHGEFVIPADVVSHLGNGNSEAGAKRLYDMMEKVRRARTGTPKQGRQINPNKYIPG
jgi:hypothetical protein